MIDILMILGCAAIGGALGLLGRYHDNKVKKEYERGYNVGYQLGKNLYQCDIDTGDKNADYAIWMGNRLQDLHYYQTIVERCALDIYYKRGDFISVKIRYGENLSKSYHCLIDAEWDITHNRREWDQFVTQIKKIEYETEQ